MKVKHLIEQLKGYPEDYDICLTTYVEVEVEGDRTLLVTLDKPLNGIALSDETEEVRFIGQRRENDVYVDIHHPLGVAFKLYTDSESKAVKVKDVLEDLDCFNENYDVCLSMYYEFDEPTSLNLTFDLPICGTSLNDGTKECLFACQIVDIEKCPSKTHPLGTVETLVE